MQSWWASQTLPGSIFVHLVNSETISSEYSLLKQFSTHNWFYLSYFGQEPAIAAAHSQDFRYLSTATQDAALTKRRLGR